MTKEEWLDSFADNLKSLIREERITQEKLATESGLSKATISKYTNGLQFPTYKAIVNLMYALNCSADDLIDFGEWIE